MQYERLVIGWIWSIAHLGESHKNKEDGIPLCHAFPSLAEPTLFGRPYQPRDLQVIEPCPIALEILLLTASVLKAWENVPSPTNSAVDIA
jgi:hypothetical protein